MPIFYNVYNIEYNESLLNVQKISRSDLSSDIVDKIKFLLGFNIRDLYNRYKPFLGVVHKQ